MRFVAGPMFLVALLAGLSVTAAAQEPARALTSAANPRIVPIKSAPLRPEFVRAIGTEPGAAPQTSPRRRDSVLDGLLIGAAVGGLLGLIPDHYDDCEECHDSLYGSIAVGAGVGLLVDALRGNRRPAVGASPVHVTVNRRSVGVRATLRWR